MHWLCLLPLFLFVLDYCHLFGNKLLFCFSIDYLFLFLSSVLGPCRPVAVLVIATCAELKLDERIARRKRNMRKGGKGEEKGN